MFGKYPFSSNPFSGLISLVINIPVPSNRSPILNFKSVSYKYNIQSKTTSLFCNSVTSRLSMVQYLGVSFLTSYNVITQTGDRLISESGSYLITEEY